MHAGGASAREPRETKKFYLPIATLVRYQPISVWLLLRLFAFTNPSEKSAVDVLFGHTLAMYCRVHRCSSWDFFALSWQTKKHFNHRELLTPVGFLYFAHP